MKAARHNTRRREVDWKMQQPLSPPLGYERIHDELRAWGRWATSGTVRRRCGSAEGRYISGYRQDDEEEGDSNAVALTEDQALTLERAVLMLEPREIAFAKQAYALARPRAALCKEFHLSADLLEATQVRVLRIIGELRQRVASAAKPVKLIRAGAPIWAGVATRPRLGV